MTEPLRSILFTGHMIDLPDRPRSRFPPHMEPAARRDIRRCVERCLAQNPGLSTGLSSGARGGDILFHEICRGVGLSTSIVLPFPPMVFIRTSVEGVPSGDWVSRFWSLWNETSESDKEVMDLPETDNAYAQCNARLIERAVAGGRFHLIALWDGKGGDGPGGTADMVSKARAQVDEPEIITPKDLIIGEGDG